MEQSYLIEVLKERYEYEQFRRNNFDNIIGLPVTILALLVGGLMAFASQKESVTPILNYCLISIMISIGMSIFYLAKVFYGFKRKYQVLPTGKAIKEQYEKLVDYHKQLNTTLKHSDLEDQINFSFNEDLAKWYIDSSDLNVKINDQRAENLHKSKLWLIISLFAIFILIGFQIISKL